MVFKHSSCKSSRSFQYLTFPLCVSRDLNEILQNFDVFQVWVIIWIRVSNENPSWTWKICLFEKAKTHWKPRRWQNLKKKKKIVDRRNKICVVLKRVRISGFPDGRAIFPSSFFFSSLFFFPLRFFLLSISSDNLNKLSTLIYEILIQVLPHKCSTLYEWMRVIRQAKNYIEDESRQR